jgi:hypothetical protein
MTTARRNHRTPTVIRVLGAVCAVVATTAMLGGTDLLAQQRRVSSRAEVVELPRVVVSGQRIALAPAAARPTAAGERSAPRGA